jgi:DNA-binding MarR family transcriptional regulator
MEQHDLANRLAAALTRVAVVADPHQRAVDAERTLAQQQLLLVLTRRPGPHRLTDLASGLAMSVEATLRAITTLTREGLVSIGPSPSYSPAETGVELTERGRRSPTEPGNWAADLLGELDGLDQPRRRDLLEQLIGQIRQLQHEDRIPIARICLTCRFFDPYRHFEDSAPHHCWLVDAPFGNLDLRLRCPEQQPGAAPEPGRPNQAGQADRFDQSNQPGQTDQPG